MSKVRYIDIKEFREKGYLFEVNRKFFHPLGLALEIGVNEDGSEYIKGVWDYRDDPEGITYGKSVIESKLAIDRSKSVRDEWEEKSEYRENLFGFTVQPVGSKVQYE